MAFQFTSLWQKVAGSTGTPWGWLVHACWHIRMCWLIHFLFLPFPRGKGGYWNASVAHLWWKGSINKVHGGKELRAGLTGMLAFENSSNLHFHWARQIGLSRLWLGAFKDSGNDHSLPATWSCQNLAASAWKTSFLRREAYSLLRRWTVAVMLCFSCCVEEKGMGLKMAAFEEVTRRAEVMTMLRSGTACALLYQAWQQCQIIHRSRNSRGRMAVKYFGLLGNPCSSSIACSWHQCSSTIEVFTASNGGGGVIRRRPPQGDVLWVSSDLCQL